jgi:hypothetical protein
MKSQIKTMRDLSLSRYGLSQWQSLPPKAHHLYHLLHKYGTFDSSLRGFGRSRLPPACEGLREVLQALENVYSSCGRPVPTIGSLVPASDTGVEAELEHLLSQLPLILKTVSGDVMTMLSRNGGNSSVVAASIGTLLLKLLPLIV